MAANATPSLPGPSHTARSTKRSSAPKPIRRAASRPAGNPSARANRLAVPLGTIAERGAGISQRVGARPDGPVASYSEDEPLARRPRVPA